MGIKDLNKKLLELRVEIIIQDTDRIKKNITECKKLFTKNKYYS